MQNPKSEWETGMRRGDGRPMGALGAWSKKGRLWMVYFTILLIN